MANFITLPEAATMLGCSLTTIHKMVDAGYLVVIPKSEANRRLRVNAEDVESNRYRLNPNMCRKRGSRSKKLSNTESPAQGDI